MWLFLSFGAGDCVAERRWPVRGVLKFFLLQVIKLPEVILEGDGNY